MMVKTVAWVIKNVPTQIQFSLVNTPWKIEKLKLWIEYLQPHDYFFHLFGKEFLDAFIAETNLLARWKISKGHLRSCSWLETYYSWRTLSIFWLNNWDGTNN